MFHIFKREMHANRVSILIWSAVMAAMAFLGFGEYGMVMGEGSNANLDGVIAMMPRVLQVMFGMGTLPIATPAGWFVCMYLWCALIAYVHAALLGAGIIAKEESDKTSEFLFTRPIKRGTVVAGKMLAAVVDLAVVVLAGWAATMIIFASYAKDAGLTGTIALTMLPGMYVTALVFLFAGFVLSSLCTGRGKAAQYAAILVILTYFAAVAIEMVGTVSYLNFLSPFKYFDATRVLDNGLEWPYLLLSAGLVAVMGYGTYFFYNRRDLHS